MTDPENAGAKLKALRERSGLTVRQVADALEMSGPSSYSHYENRYKKPFLPQELVQKLTKIFETSGIPPEETLALGGLNTGSSNSVIPGFGEGPSPRVDVSVLLDEGSKPRNAAEDPTNTIKMAIVGSQIQIAATVDKDGFDELIRRLQLAKQMIE